MRQSNGQYGASEYVPPEMMSGTYEVTLIAENEAGETARKSVMISIE